ncbi:MAG: 6-phosphofructokinase [Acidobacteriota bacterium]
MKVEKRKRKKIAVLCGGGDCPGLNAVIRAVVKTAIFQYGWEVWGSEDSFDGFIKPRKLIPMTVDSVRGILPLGGTMLGTTNRGNPFRYPEKDKKGEVRFRDYSQRVIDKVKMMGLDALILIGGDGTLTIGQMFYEAGLPVIGVPKTIDNDLLATEVTFGFDTALHTATEAIDKIHSTAESHDRVMVVEVMGRNAGWIALESGISGGADVILIPEIPFRIDKVCDAIKARADAGQSFSIIVVAEGAAPESGGKVYQDRVPAEAVPKLGGVGAVVRDMVQGNAQVETRVLVLGHLQRGGSPSPFDRFLATRFGVAAVDLAAQGQFGRMVSLKCGEIRSVTIQAAVDHQRLVDPKGERVRAARAIGISFGI